jgi:hypothetical protein
LTTIGPWAVKCGYAMRIWDMKGCLICGKPIADKRKFCSRQCYGEAYRMRLISNSGHFSKGQQSPNKGRTLESWVGEERGRAIRQKMSENSRKKAPFLRELNQDKSILERRIVSRKFHDAFVESVVTEMRKKGIRCFTLSEYVTEKRIPDAIFFDGKQLVALEVEQQKRWKPTQPAMIDRLTYMNSLAGFFDATIVIFPNQSEGLEDQVRRLTPGLTPDGQIRLNAQQHAGDFGGLKSKNADPREPADPA